MKAWMRLHYHVAKKTYGKTNNLSANSIPPFRTGEGVKINSAAVCCHSGPDFHRDKLQP